MICCVDSSFANRPSGHYQIGFLVVLADKHKHCSTLHYASRKARRVARSTMVAEALAFADGFDAAFSIRHDLVRIVNQHIPLLMIKDRNALFGVITRNRLTTEGRTMIDLALCRSAFQNHDIDNVGLVKSSVNYADDLTKLKGNGRLLTLLRTHKIDHLADNFVVSPQLR